MVYIFFAGFLSLICYNITVTEEQFEYSDDDIVRSVREGYTRNYEILIDRYKKKIVNFIHKMIFDYDEAQSLAQDAFIKVYQSIPRYRSLDNFQSFIFTVAKNITLNYIKKQKRTQFFSSFLSPSEENKHFHTKDIQHALMEKHQQDEIISAAIKNLNENQRLALILKVYLDFSYQKIEEITGWSIPKIETLISRAKANLKDQVNLMPNSNPKEKMQEKPSKNVLKRRVI
jgi:RNA polymerase sigma-70 factor (ECF subfamily)